MFPDFVFVVEFTGTDSPVAPIVCADLAAAIHTLRASPAVAATVHAVNFRTGQRAELSIPAA